ncbi:hypothetical protein AWZ03_001200 [Drosophila navojoa]|uniref:Fibronectin type-III domain-containing protein n=1 Tax=Drosophila navojoa TaxID=7232 RepID=A0A484BWA3_DRONA|nr:hypothetical protein AWZ03_001200 [Drosophila navojoa]
MPRPLKLPLLQLLLFSCLAMQHCGTALPSTAQPPPPATASSTTRSSRTTPELLLESSTTERSILDLVNAEVDGSGLETLETEFKLATHSPTASTLGATAPTSIEQQDQPPAIPATTLAFANAVAVAGDTMDSTGLAGDATPPYAAVDDSYVPSKPQNLTVLDVSANSITMSWHPPKNQNGAIAGYHVFHIHDNQTGVEIVKNSRNSAETLIHFELQNLKPFTDYRVIVKAFTTKNEGEPSDQIAQRTDVAGPSAPAIVNLTCHSQESITIRWKRPYEFYNTIDFYIIKTRLAGQDTHRDIRINASAKELETALILQNLTTNSYYEVKVAAATFSVINPKKIVLGKFSESRIIQLQPNCEKLQPLLRQSHNDYNLAVLVGIIFSCFGIVLIVMAFFLWRPKQVQLHETAARAVFLK